jgi:LysM repeat protein
MNRNIVYLGMFYMLLSSFCGKLKAQSYYRSDETIAYIDAYYTIAIQKMLNYKIPASITLAQGILESGSGKSDLALNANNHFGIKCTSDYTGEKYLKDDDIKDDCFRVYLHAEESYHDHSIFLTTRKHYSNLFTLDITDYKGWARGLKKAGYATNPKYPEILIAVIEENRLYEYDLNPEKYLQDSVKLVIPSKKEITEQELIFVEKDNINGVSCILVKSGETFYGLSRKHEITIENLKKHNDFPDDYILKAGEYIFLQKKKRKYEDQKYHEVRKGETLNLISQKYGIKKRRLIKMNGLKEEEVTEGMQLTLN